MSFGRKRQKKHIALRPKCLVYLAGLSTECACLTPVWQCPEANVPRVIKYYWNNPISAGCSRGEDRGMGAVCAGEGLGYVPAGFLCSPGMGSSAWEALAGSRWGAVTCEGTTHTISRSTSGPGEILAAAGVLPVLTSSFKGSKCINNKNGSHPWRKRCLENQGCQQHLRMNSQALPEPVT